MSVSCPEAAEARGGKLPNLAYLVPTKTPYNPNCDENGDRIPDPDMHFAIIVHKNRVSCKKTNQRPMECPHQRVPDFYL